MEMIFSFIGSIFGYILWAAFYFVKNFGIAIVIFTIIIKAILFPFSVKQQKSMASNARFQQKQREIMEKYKNNRMKANEEIQKLMVKENVSPYAGCLPMIAPMLVMLGVYYSVREPLTNTLHIASDKVTEALNCVATLPGIGTSINSMYGQISVVKYFDSLQPYLVKDGTPMFNSYEVDKINDFASGFNFCGLDLLATPSASSFSSMLWLIPVLCFLSYVLSMFITQKMNGTKMQGCMVVMFLAMPLFSAWIAYTVPAAVGFYWIASSVFGFVQSVIMNKFYNANIMEAKAEAQRVLLRRTEEKAVQYIDVPDYQYIEETKDNNSNSSKNNGKSKKPKKNKTSSGSDYQGKKK